MADLIRITQISTDKDFCNHIILAFLEFVFTEIFYNV